MPTRSVAFRISSRTWVANTRSNAVGGQWGMMAALQGAEVAAAPISEATGHLKTVPESLYQVAEVFFA